MFKHCPYFVERLRNAYSAWKYFQQQILCDRILNFIKYICTGKTNNTISLLNENFYKSIQIGTCDNSDVLLYQIQTGWQRRCTTHEKLCPPYHALTHCAKNYWGRDILLECLQSGEEPVGLNFHGRFPKYTPFSVSDLKQVKASEIQPVNGVHILTSIAPKRIEEQKTAIGTWVAQGFIPVAINYPHEIEILQPLFPEVKFVPVLRDTTQKLGRPRVFLNDVFDYARTLANEASSSVVGVVNSDVGLYCLDVAVLLGVASQGLVFSRRADVTSHIHSKGVVYDYGYDAMFFNPQILPELPETHFALGEPWWDLIFPMNTLLHDIPVYTCVPILCFHVDHHVNWSEKSWFEFADTSVNFLLPLFEKQGKSCLNLYNTLQYAKNNMHDHTVFLLEFAHLLNHILNTIPDTVDCVVRNSFRDNDTKLKI